MKKLRAAFAIAIAFSMGVISCSESDGTTDSLDFYNLRLSAPSTQALEIGRITPGEFDQIRAAAGSSFAGWAISPSPANPQLVMAWRDANMQRFTQTYTALIDIRDPLLIGLNPRPGSNPYSFEVRGMDFLIQIQTAGYICGARGTPTYFAAGTMIVYLW